MAAYTQQGAAVQTGGFGQIAPSAVDPNSAFELLGKAFKQGLISSAEINEAINVVPAEQRTRQIEARDKAEQAQSDIRLRPELEPLRKQKAELEIKGAQQRLDDPFGLKQSMGKKLFELGVDPTGDLAVDSKAYRTKTQQLADLAEVVADLRKEELPVYMNPDADPATEIPRLRTELQKGRDAKMFKKIFADKAEKDQKAKDETRKMLIQNATELSIPLTGFEGKSNEELSVIVADARKAAENAKLASAGASKATEGDKKRVVFTSEIDTVNKKLAELEKQGIVRPTLKGTLLTPAATSDFQIFNVPARSLMSGDEKMWLDSTEKWIEAVLRDRSGAAIAKKEYGNARMQYFPGPDADAKEIRYKADLRQNALDAMRGTISGGGKGMFFTADGKITSGELVPPEAPSTPASPAAPAPAPAAAPQPADVMSGTLDGKKVYYKPDPANPGKAILTDPAGVPLP
jgi:hypothetical protein